MTPWVDRLLGVVQAILILVAFVAGLAYLQHWAVRQQARVKAQIDRIEAKVDGAIEYEKRRDVDWARAIGLPEPAWTDEDETTPGDITTRALP